MADAPDTSTYVLVSPDTADLPNSRVLIGDVTNGIQVLDTGPTGNLQVTTIGNLRTLMSFDFNGFITYNATSNTFVSRTVTGDGTSILVTSGDGVTGNATISAIAGGSVQQVNVFNNSGVTPITTVPNLNFITASGSSTSVTVQPNVGTNSADIIIQGIDSGAPSNATYITQTPSAGLSAEQSLSTLATGLLINTTITGVLTSLANGTNGQVLTITGGVPTWGPASSGGAPVNATYITQTPNGTLTNEQPLSALSTGILLNTISTGVLTSLANSSGDPGDVLTLNGGGLPTWAAGGGIATIQNLDGTIDVVSGTGPTTTISVDPNLTLTDLGLQRGAGTVVLQASAIPFGNWNFVFPTGAGSPNQVLSTDGSGITSWTSGGSNGQFLTYGSGSIPTWTSGIAASKYTAAGDLLYGTGIATTTNLSIGAGGQVLSTGTGTNVPAWTSSGTIGDVLTYQGAAAVPTWTTPTAGGAPSNATYITQTGSSGLSAEQAIDTIIPNTSGAGTNLLLMNSSTGILSGLANSVTNGQILTTQGGLSAWYSRIIDSGSNTPYNFYMGSSAGNTTNSGNSNMAGGIAVLSVMTNASLNVGFGQNVFNLVSTGSNNTGLGAGVGLNLTTGNNNTFLGANGCGSGIGTGTNNTFVGYGASAGGDYTNSGAFGANVQINANNSINIGDGVNVGLNQSAPFSVMHVSSGPTSGLADLRMDASSTIPTIHAGTGTLYVTNSTGTNADRLWFQPAVGSSIDLTSGGTGGVSSVGLSSTTGSFTFSGSPITSSGVINIEPLQSRIYSSGSNFNLLFVDTASRTLTSTGNTGFGQGALTLLTGGTSNTSFGADAGFSISTGSENVCIGGSAGATILTASNNTIIGSGSDVLNATIHDSGVFGRGATVNQSYSIRIGNLVNVGINQAVPQQALHISPGVIPASGLTSNIAAIQMDNSTATPSASTGAGILYVTSSTGTNADELIFVPGVGSPIQLNFPVSGTPGQLLSLDLSNQPFWTSNLNDSGNTSPYNFYLGSTAGNTSITGTFNTLMGTNMLSGLTNSGANNNNTTIGSGLAAPTLCTNFTFFGAANNADWSILSSTIVIGNNNANTQINMSGNIIIGNNNFNSITSPSSNNDNIVIGNDIDSAADGITESILIGKSITFPTAISGADNLILIGNNTSATGANLIDSAAIGSGASVTITNAISIGNGVNVGLNQSAPNEALHVGTGSSGTKAAIYIEGSSTTPTAPSGAVNDGVLYMNSNKALHLLTGSIQTSGQVLSLNAGSMGSTTLSGGSASVGGTSCLSTSFIFVCYAGVPSSLTTGALSVSGQDDSGNFTINSNNPLDVNDVIFLIITPQ